MENGSIGEIHLRRVAVDTVIGVFEEERQQPQRLYVSVVLHADFAAVQLSDRLEDGTDYTDVIRSIHTFAATDSSRMLEHFAHHLAVYLKTSYGARSVEITVEKPRYAAELGVDSIAVRVVR